MKSLKSVARKLAAAGRGGDTKLVHVNAAEVKALIAMGGSNTVNPKTGLREFFHSPSRSSSRGSNPGFSSSKARSVGLSGQQADLSGALSQEKVEAVGAGGSQDDREAELKRQADLAKFNASSRASVEPAGSKTNLSSTQRTIATGLKLAAGLLIPGGGLVTGAASALEFFFGPGSQPAFQRVAQGPGGGDFGRLGIERNSGSGSKAGAVQQAAQVTRSVNAASSRITGSASPNVADPRTSQVAALTRRRGESSTSKTVLTSLRGIVGGTGKAKKRALGI